MARSGISAHDGGSMQHTRWASALTTGILLCAGMLTASPASSAAVRAWTVTATAASPRVEQGQPADVDGSVSPRSPGKRVALQVRSHGRWVDTLTTRLGKDSTFHFHVQLQPKVGSVRYRVSAPGSAGRAPGHSDPFVLTVVAYPRPQPWGEIQMGEDHSCGLGDVDADGAGLMFCWGDNNQYSMGGGVSGSEVPFAVALTRDTWTDVSSGHRFSCGIKSDSSMWCWGVNFRGQLGNGRDTMAEPLRDSLGTGWTAVNSGIQETCGIRAGDIYCWGSMWSAGSDGTGQERVPLRITESGGWVQALPDFGGLCALRVDSTVWCGEFAGLNTALAQVGSTADWVALSPGRSNEGVCGLESSGNFSCFSTDGTFTPSRALPGDVWTSVDTSEHTCGVQVDGSLWCKGPNRYGQLGNGTRTSSSTPVRVGSDTDWRQVTVGDNATCATKDNGTNWCWGDLNSGRLGYVVYSGGTTANFQSTPLQVHNRY